MQTHCSGQVIRVVSQIGLVALVRKAGEEFAESTDAQLEDDLHDISGGLPVTPVQFTPRSASLLSTVTDVSEEHDELSSDADADAKSNNAGKFPFDIVLQLLVDWSCRDNGYQEQE